MASSVDLHFPQLSELLSPWWPGTHPAGVPPHITLSYPWVDAVTEEAIEAVTEIASTTSRFEVRFTGVDTFDSGVVFLRPEPDREVRNIITRLARRFPEAPLYGGTITDPIPHLTVARASPGASVQELRADIADALASVLPIHLPVTVLSVMEERPNGNWVTISQPTLGP